MGSVWFQIVARQAEVDQVQPVGVTVPDYEILQFDVVVDVTRFIMESLQCFNHLNTNLAYSVQSKRRLKFLKVVF